MLPLNSKTAEENGGEKQLKSEKYRTNIHYSKNNGFLNKIVTAATFVVCTTPLSQTSKQPTAIFTLFFAM